LAKAGINVIKKPNQLRAKISGDFNAVLKGILSCDLQNVGRLGEPISGTYDANVLTIKEPIPGAQAGDQIYFVQATKAGAVTSTKELSPASLRVTGKQIPISTFLRTIEDAVQSSKIDDKLKIFLKELMEASGSTAGNIHGEMIDQLDEKDFKMISNDFGEISGAYWYAKVHNTSVTSIEYPSRSNEKLIDYYAYAGQQKIAVSAKAGGGSAPSIKSIAEILKQKKPYSDVVKERARKSIIAISDNTVIDGIMESAKLLKSIGYEYLKKHYFKKDFTAVDVEKYLARYKSASGLLGDFADFYKAIGRDASAKSADEIIKSKLPRKGLLISPLAYSLVDELNKNKHYVEVLNDAAKSIQLTQIYMQIPNKQKRKAEYVLHEFKNANFGFEYHSNAKKPDNNRIGFELLK
jgi:hypothetical protein